MKNVFVRRWQGSPEPKISLVAKAGRIPSLDGLRAISVSIVLLSHFWDPTLIPGGLGVLIFFVISGFLITRLLFLELNATGALLLRRFYFRRFLRLYPVLLTYTVVIIFLYIISGAHISWIEPLSTLFYFANYFYSYLSTIGETGGTMPFALFWSLSIEEHFYIIFPLAFLALAGKPRHFAIVLTILCVVILALRVVVAVIYPEFLKSLVFYYQTQFRADSLIAGVLLAVGCETERGRCFILRYLCHPLAAGLAILLILITLAVRDNFFRETIRYSLQSFAVAAIVATVVFTNNLPGVFSALNHPLMCWIGRLSYSLYVWHPIVRNLIIKDRTLMPRPLDLVVSLALAFLLASASYYLIETPILRLRHRYGSRARD